MTAPTAAAIQDYIANLVKFSGPANSEGWREIHCPRPGQHKHGDANASAVININSGYIECHACGFKGLVGKVYADLGWPAPPWNGHKSKVNPGELPITWKGFPILKWHHYTDRDGAILYSKGRYVDANGRKQFVFWCQGGPGFKNKSVPRVPYKLHKIVTAEEIIIVEGESDVEAGETLGLTCTTTDAGARGNPSLLANFIRPDQRCVVIGDEDVDGEAYRNSNLNALNGKVASLKSIRLGVKDLRDWINARLDDPIAAAEQLSRMIDGAEEWKEETPSIIHWAKEALEPQPAKIWTLQNIIGPGDVLALVGDAGSKKTRTSTDVAVCVAKGEEWLGRYVSRSNVLIVDEESGEHRIKSWLGDCMRAHEAGPDLPLAFTTMAGITLADQAGADFLSKIITETQSKFVVMDALQDFTLGMDENSGQELAPVIHRLKVIAERLNCAIWLIHHVNKQGAYRGHSSIKGLIDVMLKCESETSSSLIQFTAEKSRDSLIAPFAATAHFDLGRFWLTDADPKAPVQNMGRGERYVMGYLMNQPDKTAKVVDIVSHADICTGNSARTALYNLADQGKISRVDDGRRGQPATYKWVSL